VVSAEGYVSKTLPGIQVPAEQPLRVTLSPGSRISGRVVDESGAPVARARVLAVPEGPGGGGAAGPLDENGGFVIENLSPGRFTLAVAAPGFPPVQRKGIEVAAGKDVSGLEVAVRKGATVEGRVTAADGRPAPGTRLRVMPAADSGGPLLAAVGLPEAVAGEDGAYQLEGVPEGTRSIAAEERDHPKAVQTLAVQPGSNRLDFQLVDGREVSGRVIDPQGQPVPGAEVSLSSRSAARYAATGPDGGFRMTAIPDGAYRLLAKKDGWAPAQSAEEVRVAGGPVEGLVLRLDRGGAIVGRITGLAFEELSRAQISASGPSGGQLGRVDYQGSYRIEALPPGEWVVEAQLPGGRRAVGRIQLAPGQAQASLDLEFGGGLTLRGVVLQGDHPVAGAMVTVQDPNGALHGARSGPDGRFRVDGLDAGPVEVVVLGKDTPFRQPLDLSADREIVLRLP
jgi:carboxypeptidase family protein